MEESGNQLPGPELPVLIAFGGFGDDLFQPVYFYVRSCIKSRVKRGY